MKQSDRPFLSIVTAVLNDVAGLRRTAASLKEQSFRDFEWIVMDGASQDGSAEFMQRSENASALFTTSSDLGIYDAMNKGTQRASGRYVNYLNAGDTYCEASSLQLLNDEAGKNGYPEVIYAGTNYEFADGSLRYRPPREAGRAIRHGVPAIHQSTFYLRSYLENPPYDLRYRISSDYYLAARSYLRRGRAVYVDKAITIFPIGGASTAYRKLNVIEAWSIQKEVLNLPLRTRVLSLLRRLSVHMAVDCLQAIRKRKAWWS